MGRWGRDPRSGDLPDKERGRLPAALLGRSRGGTCGPPTVRAPVRVVGSHAGWGASLRQPPKPWRANPACECRSPFPCSTRTQLSHFRSEPKKGSPGPSVE